MKSFSFKYLVDGFFGALEGLANLSLRPTPKDMENSRDD
jgi:hypothetical protein